MLPASVESLERNSDCHQVLLLLLPLARLIMVVDITDSTGLAPGHLSPPVHTADHSCSPNCPRCSYVYFAWAASSR